MAYTSDLRIKNTLKSLHIEILNELISNGIISNLKLRIFDESNEDSRLFEDGGLTFKDPYVDLKLGSNDAGWILDDKPLVIVEGTFGTERGQFGDGQLNRFSHSAGVAMNGYIGVTFVPFRGESYSKSGTKPKDIVSNNIKLKYATIHKGFLTGAIKISEKEIGWFLVIDSYNKTQLKKIVIEAVKQKMNIKNELNLAIEEVLSNMRNSIGTKAYGENSNQIISDLIDEKGNVLSKRARFYTQNYNALTTSEKRDGHGMLGKNLIEIYASDDVLSYSIFIRLRNNEIQKLKARNSKEFKYIFNHPKVAVRCFDNLVFTDEKLRSKLLNIIDTNMFQERQTLLLKEIQQAFNEGLIRVKE